MSPCYIAFDAAHKPRGRIDENYSDLRDYLNSNGFICYNFLETPITQESLKPYDILVFSCPDFSKISLQEITEIENWVKNDGGGLLLLSHAGGDRGRNSNLSELSQQFGIVFENDQVLDDEKNIGMENIPIITSFIPPHPITEGIGELCFRASCSLSTLVNAFAIASSNDTSDPFSSPLICVASPENGRVCCVGSYEMFRNKIGGGFKHGEHSKFALNIFRWLVSDYRIDLKSNNEVSENEIQSTSMPSPEIKPQGASDSESPSVNIDFAIKISKKSELMELLKIFSNQINTIKKTIDNLIEQVSISEDEIIELKKVKRSKVPVKPQDFKNIEQDIIDDFQVTDETKDQEEKDQAAFSALPDKPPNLFEEETSTEKFSSGLPIVEETIRLKSKPKSKPKSLSKEILEAEMQGLENKINSVRDLLSFIEKKHNSGKLDDDSYKKQAKTLKKDLKKSKKRIEEINKIFEE